MTRILPEIATLEQNQQQVLNDPDAYPRHAAHIVVSRVSVIMVIMNAMHPKERDCLFTQGVIHSSFLLSWVPSQLFTPAGLSISQAPLLVEKPAGSSGITDSWPLDL